MAPGGCHPSEIGGPPMSALARSLEEYRDAAQEARLVYVAGDAPGISRRKTAKGFTYWGADGSRVRDARTLNRIKALAVPPAWTNVWICGSPNGHIQAIGWDQKGRKQYRYHARFREVRDEAKFDHMLSFAEGLPGLREKVRRDMAARGLGRDKVLATVVNLLETTMIRVGNSAYARDNKSFGLTTLHNRHVQVKGDALMFQFKGKSGKEWRVDVRNRRLARIIRSCQELPGQHLFQYLDDDGERQAVSSADVNAYLKAAADRDITAKDFRTWWGTVHAAEALAACQPFESEIQANRLLVGAVDQVAGKLGNTRAVCRKCYIHPEVIGAFLEKDLALDVAEPPEGLSTEEMAVLSLLKRRLGRMQSANDPA